MHPALTPLVVRTEVAVLHISCLFGIHPEVRKRGGKTKVKDPLVLSMSGTQL